MKHLHRTISGWGVLAGTICLLAGRRRAAVWLWRLVGLGGVGAVYGHYCASKGIDVEPVPILKALIRDDARQEPLRAAAWHGVMWALAEWLDRFCTKSPRTPYDTRSDREGSGQ